MGTVAQMVEHGAYVFRVLTKSLAAILIQTPVSLVQAQSVPNSINHNKERHTQQILWLRFTMFESLMCLVLKYI